MVSGGTQPNPYAEYATLASGDRFIGRHPEVALLADVVAGGKASRAIVGLPRVGKTSLARSVWQAASPLDKVDTLWIDVSSISPERTLVDALQRELAVLDGGEFVSGELAYERLKEMLAARRRNGRRVVLIFDEFDSVRHTADAPLSVRRLRELLIDPARHVITAVLVCRRELETIEDQILDLSNLANACPTISLKPFTESELHELAARGYPDGLSGTTFALLRECTGGYPVLAEEALMHLYGGAPQDSLPSLLRLPSDQVMSQVRELLISAGLWPTLVSITNSTDNIFSLERERLLAYGVVIAADGRSVVASEVIRRFVLQSAAVPPAWSTDAS